MLPSRRLRLASIIAAESVKDGQQSTGLPSGTEDVKPGGAKAMTHADIETRAREMYGHFQTQGIPVDVPALDTHRGTTQVALDAILDKLEAKYGFRPNPNRPEDYAKIAQQAGHALPVQPSSGRPKTDEYTIERAAKDVPDLKELQKARSVRRKVSILTNLGKAAKEGKLFPTYSIDPTLGRTHAGGDANPMNFEKDIQNHIKDPGHVILVADYSRIEPKVLATMSGDPQLISDLAADPYMALAKTAFNTQTPSPTQRNQAKVALLAMIYGNTASGIAAQLGVPKYVAEKIMAAFHKRYPTTSAFMEQLKVHGRTKGYAESHHGRQKPLDKPDPDANDRLAVNSVIQNTAGDLARVGFHNVYTNQELKAMGVKFITTVHDSLILSVPLSVDLEKVKAIVKKEMVDNNDSKFDLAVEFKSGDSWGTAK